MVGRTVLHYQFLERLGSGGMGDIYKAMDTRLNRFVAIKVLTTAAAGDPERRRRFIQEAQAASALNHPNIITIHDIVSEGNTEFMVMEYVTGKTLVDLIPKGGLRVPQVLKYSVQMADALQAAHASGIVHRDLKPANVMVTDSGLVKILDFGLAKLTDRGPLTTLSGPTDVTRTIADAPMTVEGSIIGTVSYMSPEQAQGKKVDTRSDIFSFGVVLYEMVTGARAFQGDSALTTLSAILRDEAPPVAGYAPDAPPQMEMVIRRCLRKQPDDRWQTMQDVLMALAALKHESDSGTLYRARLTETGAVRTSTGAVPTSSGGVKIPQPERKAGPGPVLVGVVGGTFALVAALGGSIWWARHHNQPAPPVEQAAAPTPEPAAPAAPEPPAPQDPAPAPVNPDAPLTNDDVIQMVQAKVSPDHIIAAITASNDRQFNIKELRRLTQAGVPSSVIDVMFPNSKKAVQDKAVQDKAAQANTPTPAHSTPKQPAPAQPPSTTPANSQASNTPPAPVQPQQPAASPTPVPAPQTAQQQTASTAPSTTAAKAPTAVKAGGELTVVRFQDSTPFAIALAEDVRADAKKGDPLKFTVQTEARAGDVLVIPKGTTLTGAVVQERKKGGAFGGGKPMTFSLNPVELPDGRLTASVRGSVEDNVEKRKSTDSIAAPKGTQYVVYIDPGQSVSVRK
jgi:hypothetical protein